MENLWRDNRTCWRAERRSDFVEEEQLISYKLLCRRFFRGFPRSFETPRMHEFDFQILICIISI